MNVVKEISTDIGILRACEALGLSRATYYRKLSPVKTVTESRSKHFRALSEQEEKQVLDCLNSERFVDKSPGEVCHYAG